MYINQEPNPLKYNEIINFLMYQQDSSDDLQDVDFAEGIDTELPEQFVVQHCI